MDWPDLDLSMQLDRQKPLTHAAVSFLRLDGECRVPSDHNATFERRKCYACFWVLQPQCFFWSLEFNRPLLIFQNSWRRLEAPMQRRQQWRTDRKTKSGAGVWNQCFSAFHVSYNTLQNLKNNLTLKIIWISICVSCQGSHCQRAEISALM